LYSFSKQSTRPDGWDEITAKFGEVVRGNKNDRCGSSRGDRGGSERGGRGGHGGRGGRDGKGTRQYTIEEADVTPLAKTDNAYVIRREYSADEGLRRQITNILNKLTPENFDKLLAQMNEIKIESENNLHDVTCSVFEKAVSQPNFAPTYADFASELQQTLPSFEKDGEDGSKETLSFKRMLLMKCQDEFEASNLMKKSPEETKDTKNDEEKLAQTKKRKRQLGMICFIGELFVRRIVNVQIVKSCIDFLIPDPETPNEDSIEALCKLLETAGSALENHPKANFEEIMNQLDTAKLSGKLLSRYRFMIQDLQDLRTDNWVSKRKVVQKKIAEIHEESEYRCFVSSFSF
jgi:translation initiation factor 4G